MSNHDSSQTDEQQVNPQDWRSINDRLTAALKPTAAPVAIFFLQEGSVAPVARLDETYAEPNDAGRTGQVPAGCVFWIKGSSAAFATTASDHAGLSRGPGLLELAPLTFHEAQFQGVWSRARNSIGEPCGRLHARFVVDRQLGLEHEEPRTIDGGEPPFHHTQTELRAVAIESRKPVGGWGGWRHRLARRVVGSDPQHGDEPRPDVVRLQQKQTVRLGLTFRDQPHAAQLCVDLARLGISKRHRQTGQQRQQKGHERERERQTTKTPQPGTGRREHWPRERAPRREPLKHVNC